VRSFHLRPKRTPLARNLSPCGACVAEISIANRSHAIGAARRQRPELPFETRRGTPRCPSGAGYGGSDRSARVKAPESGLAQAALDRGGHLRVGLEDYAGTRTPRNVELVEQLAELITASGRTIATVEETHQILGIPVNR
jgi:hypothetical protein